MTVGKTHANTDYSLEKALADLAATDFTRSSQDAKRLAFMKMYKHFSATERRELCCRAAAGLLSKFQNQQRLEGMITLLACGFAAERDWESASALLNEILHQSHDAEFFRELALILLEISDTQFEERQTRIPLGQTLLVLLTELGLQLASRTGQSALDHRDTARVVEYITTNLLARSNVNNTAMRVSLIHYLARCPINSQTTMQLNRVISRFGQSLLDELLTGFFEDKRKGNAAFFFLVEHLKSFFMASPALAEMSHNVLKHYMLKHPTEFPLFLASYSEWVAREETALKLASKHIALLFRAAHDVSQKALGDAIGKILIKHLTLFAEVSDALLSEQLEAITQILVGSSKAVRHPSFEEFLKEANALLGTHDAAQKVVNLKSARKPKEAHVKLAKVGEKPSPLEQMLQLAS